MLALSFLACRPDPVDTVEVTTTIDGDTYTAQCSGWFPDWIAESTPAGTTFQLSQGYPLGVPVITDVNGTPTVTSWDPPSPATGAAAPWRAHNLNSDAERLAYLAALKDYALAGMVEADWVAQANTTRRWYHVPMMTTGLNPREGLRGATSERVLRADEQSWLNTDTRSFGLGYYNPLAAYTIGRVFDDPEPSNSNPERAQFIDGAFVVKILFAEDKPGAFKTPNPLANAPMWTIQDLQSPNDAGTVNIRFLQMDIAVKDVTNSPDTGWVFAEFVYDESMAAATPADRWRSLAPVGLQWGNDQDVTALGVGVLDETWIADASLIPDAFEGHLGRHGRLNGPVDNPVSACMSCHSTAQAYTPGSSFGAFKAVGFFPADVCTDARDMFWFRSIPGNQPFSRMIDDPAIGGSDFCMPQVPNPANLYALDYSLQIQLGLALGMGDDTPNPCASLVPEEQLAQARGGMPAGDEGSGERKKRLDAMSFRVAPREAKPVKLTAAEWKEMMTVNPEQELR